MQTIDLSRERQLHRLIDSYSSTEASDALCDAAEFTAGRSDVLSRILRSTQAVVVRNDDDARNTLYEIVQSPELEPLVRDWIRELREIAAACPDIGACTIASALTLWSWTLNAFREQHVDALESLADTFSRLVTARCLILDVIGVQSEIRSDLCFVYAAREAASAGAACAELVFGYRRHPTWDAAGCAACYTSEELDGLEGVIPGFASGARTTIDIIENDGSHPVKRGPCVPFSGVEAFHQLRDRLDGCLSGARLARQRAAATIARRD
jgi:hypothetical protein